MKEKQPIVSMTNRLFLADISGFLNFLPSVVVALILM